MLKCKYQYIYISPIPKCTRNLIARTYTISLVLPHVVHARDVKVTSPDNVIKPAIDIFLFCFFFFSNKRYGIEDPPIIQKNLYEKKTAAVGRIWPVLGTQAQ